MTGNRNVIDIDRIRRKHARRFAVAALIGYCNGICRSSILSIEMSKELRKRSDAVSDSFGMNLYEISDDA